MNDKTDLGSYYFIDICSKLTVILTIIAAIGIFIYGIVASTIFAWWYFIVVYLCGGFALVCFYFFNMLLISLCHNVYIIKKSLVNADGDVSNNNRVNIFQNEESIKDIRENLEAKDVEIDVTTLETEDDGSIRCPVCLTKLKEDETKCPNCGFDFKNPNNDLRYMSNKPLDDECPCCFAKISPEDTECPNCGYKLK